MADGTVQGSGPLNPHEKRMAEQEYRQSADLFKRALAQYQKSENPYQQEEFKEVMDQALQVLNETAKDLVRKDLQKQNQQIAKDYDTFQKFPKDPDTVQKLSQELDRAKRSVD